MTTTVGFITPEYPHGSVRQTAGIGTSLGNLVPELVKKGIRVILFVYGQDADEEIAEDGYILYRIKNRNYRFAGWYFNRKFLQDFISQKIRIHTINIIEAPDWTGITAFCSFPVPLVMRFHGSDTYFCHLEKRPQKWKNRWFEKVAAKNADAFVAPTKFAAELSASLLEIKKPVEVIYNGLSTDKFKNQTPLDFDSGLLLYTGTLIRKKGVLELPAILKEVWKKYPNARLVLIGGDAPDIKTGHQSTWQLIQESIDAEKRHLVEWLGKIPYQQMQQHILKAQVCLYPTFAETMGMVTIEAMAMQKPVVSSNFGWVSEIMEDGKSGFMEDPTNHGDFAQKIAMLLSDNELCYQIGKNAREFVSAKFDSKMIAEKNIAFYQQILKNLTQT
ncbi:glycosyltransferase family 4 protein [Flavobacterium silvaticum]|uniref:Glycosyltransferase family 4 protein n=1 Tax=Flavobacterium silvaticum TaxID=1852020 RepID=A0A972FUC1_9FLAO|nr:glycosyltransferase family 4 protein [Flavobacterium silvaticum]NMH29479.1 glycosyltransferase family 4 protein [Flavobacterium silvaticum]